MTFSSRHPNFWRDFWFLAFLFFFGMMLYRSFVDTWEWRTRAGLGMRRAFLLLYGLLFVCLIPAGIYSVIVNNEPGPDGGSSNLVFLNIGSAALAAVVAYFLWYLIMWIDWKFFNRSHTFEQLNAGCGQWVGYDECAANVRVCQQQNNYDRWQFWSNTLGQITTTGGPVYLGLPLGKRPKYHVLAIFIASVFVFTIFIASITPQY